VTTKRKTPKRKPTSHGGPDAFEVMGMLISAIFDRYDNDHDVEIPAELDEDMSAAVAAHDCGLQPTNRDVDVAIQCVLITDRDCADYLTRQVIAISEELHEAQVSPSVATLRNLGAHWGKRMRHLRVAHGDDVIDTAMVLADGGTDAAEVLAIAIEIHAHKVT